MGTACGGVQRRDGKGPWAKLLNASGRFACGNAAGQKEDKGLERHRKDKEEGCEPSVSGLYICTVTSCICVVTRSVAVWRAGP